MNILPKYGLLQFRNAARIYSKSITESLQLFKEETKFLKTSLFFSYKHDELEELDSAINFLKGFGVLIYADYLLLDQSTPEKPSKITDKQIQERTEEKIKDNRKFIFLATENAIISKRCKWELRYANTQKTKDHIAIFPIREDYTDYGGSEYLQKFHYIQKSETNPEGYDVKSPNGDVIELSAWLAS
ncbi:TIR domain-containing protein [Aquimarina macrocephali]|uniref:TIR domain-containing protein n=1 Tax=Aquimarina macrocephali TaxID=666563 RepID=UPI000464345A|nr:TIR domain-containing protein [Aquimarina macrocephali]